MTKTTTKTATTTEPSALRALVAEWKATTASEEPEAVRNAAPSADDQARAGAVTAIDSAAKKAAAKRSKRQEAAAATTEIPTYTPEQEAKAQRALARIEKAKAKKPETAKQISKRVAAEEAARLPAVEAALVAERGPEDGAAAMAEVRDLMNQVVEQGAHALVLAAARRGSKKANQVAKTPERKAKPAKAPKAPKVSEPDPRIPAAGSEIKVTVKGKTLVCTVTATGFEFNGETFTSLTSAAKAAAISVGTTTRNGFTFWGLDGEKKPSKTAQVRDALSVLVLDPAIRAFLAEHDPKALAQAEAALA